LFFEQFDEPTAFVAEYSLIVKDDWSVLAPGKDETIPRLLLQAVRLKE
jgi:hypothetical protein